MEKEAALPYVVIEVGYEGIIDRIIWSTEDPEEAIKVVRELREAIREFYEIWEKGLNEAMERAGLRRTEESEAIEPEELEEIRKTEIEIEMEETEKAVKAVIEKFKDRDLFYVYKRVIEFAKFTDPYRICVQRFDIQGGGFRCFCDELGVGAGRED